MWLERLTQNLDSIDEFEKCPVPKSQLKSDRSFWGLYASEHTAGTEFVIGPLFVVHGVAFWDLLWGLLLGNLLAVLSWALVCAAHSHQSSINLICTIGKNLWRTTD